MKKLIGIILLVMLCTTLSFAQESGEMWLIKFKLGSSFIEELHPDSLAKLDYNMATLPPMTQIIFYGAADSTNWNNSSYNRSRALDGGKRLDRALTLRARYPWRTIHVSATHEPVTGVKVVWYPYKSDTTVVNNYTIIKPDTQLATTEIKIPLGASMWAFHDNMYVLPYVGVIVKKNKWEIGGKIGAIPFTFENDKSNSFVAGTVTRMVTPEVGVNGHIFVTWEYLTALDEWTKKAAGISFGLTGRRDRAEININMLLLNQVVHDDPNSSWYVGTVVFLQYYVK